MYGVPGMYFFYATKVGFAKVRCCFLCFLFFFLAQSFALIHFFCDFSLRLCLTVVSIIKQQPELPQQECIYNDSG